MQFYYFTDSKNKLTFLMRLYLYYMQKACQSVKVQIINK